MKTLILGSVVATALALSIGAASAQSYRDGDGSVTLTPEQRCGALEGELGRNVSCRIYNLRPSGCRRVVAGGAECLAARAERGIR